MYIESRRIFLTQILTLPVVRLLPVAIVTGIAVSETSSGWVLRADDV